MCAAVGLPSTIGVPFVIVAQSNEAKKRGSCLVISRAILVLFKFLMVPMVVRALTCGVS